jgi:1,4-dihydroxy-2-naphthoate octaprenyltransferase
MESRPSSLVVWSTAARPHTLTASISPCLVAFALTPSPWHLRLAWLIFCFTVQIGTNLHNDYSDYVQGADTDKRVGQPRATAKGWLTPAQTCRAATAVLSVTFLSGVYLLSATNQLGNPFAWFLVLTSVFNAFAYTGGPYPLGYIGLGHLSIAYAGLGDLFVLLYFGLVAVLMIPYLLYCEGRPIDWVSQFSLGTSVGVLATNIIIVNNLRDRHTDILANKKTTAVRFGREFSLGEYVFCNTLAYAIIIMEALRLMSPWRLLPLLSLPLAIRETKAIFVHEGQSLNAHVGATALVQFAFSLLLSIGCLMQ